MKLLTDRKGQVDRYGCAPAKFAVNPATSTKTDNSFVYSDQPQLFVRQHWRCLVEAWALVNHLQEQFFSIVIIDTNLLAHAASMMIGVVKSLLNDSIECNFNR